MDAFTQNYDKKFLSAFENQPRPANAILHLFCVIPELNANDISVEDYIPELKRKFNVDVSIEDGWNTIVCEDKGIRLVKKPIKESLGNRKISWLTDTLRPIKGEE